MLITKKIHLFRTTVSRIPYDDLWRMRGPSLLSDREDAVLVFVLGDTLCR